MSKIEGKYDYIVKDDEMLEYCSDIEKLKEAIKDVASDLTSLKKIVSHTIEWQENGRDEFVDFLALIEQYALYLAGDSTMVLERGYSAISGKEVTGGEDHFEGVISAINTFIDSCSLLEKGGEGESVKKLDAIQGESIDA